MEQLAETFPFDDVTPAMLEGLNIERDNERNYLAQSVEALDARGRSDLTRPVLRILDKYDRLTRRRKALSAIRRLIVRRS